jgi:hypothetical protein
MTRSVIVSILFVIIGCSSSPVPKGILPPERMQKVVYDLIRIDEFINNFAYKDSSTNIKNKRSTLYKEAFKVNNTNRKQFYLSYKYYQQHPDIQKRLFDTLY